MSYQRILYVDILRIIATFAMIFLHLAATKWYSIPIESINWQILNIYDSSVRWCVPVFIMISGVIFLDPTRNISASKIFKKYLPHIFITLIFWGCVYIFVYHFKQYIYQNKPFDIKLVEDVLLMFLNKAPWYHLWFLYTIAGLYILTPILRTFTSNCSRKTFEYSILIFGVFGTFIPLLNELKPYVFPSIPLIFIPGSFFGFIGYFISGYYFSKFEISHRSRMLLYFSAIISLLFTIVITSLVSAYNKKPSINFYGFTLTNTMFLSFAVFIYVKQIASNLTISPKFLKLLVTISQCTLGIYLVHDLTIQGLKIMGINPLTYPPFIFIPILSVIVFLISFAIVLSLKKIYLLNKTI